MTGIRAQWSLGAAGPMLAREEREEADWRGRSACRDADPEIFFAENGDFTKARAICRACPVLRECLGFVMTAEAGKGADHRFGMSAALEPVERWRLDPLTTGTLRQIRKPAKPRAKPRPRPVAVPDFTDAEVTLFWSRTRPGPCGPEWALSVTADGFGMFRVTASSPRTAAHRLAYKLATGREPGTDEVTQACGNRRCLAAPCLAAVPRHGHGGSQPSAAVLQRRRARALARSRATADVPAGETRRGEAQRRNAA